MPRYLVQVSYEIDAASLFEATEKTKQLLAQDGIQGGEYTLETLPQSQGGSLPDIGFL